MGGWFRPGGVTISRTLYMPPDASKLKYLFEKMVEESSVFDDIYDHAIFIFLTIVRTQFF